MFTPAVPCAGESFYGVDEDDFGSPQRGPRRELFASVLTPDAAIDIGDLDAALRTPDGAEVEEEIVPHAAAGFSWGSMFAVVTRAVGKRSPTSLREALEALSPRKGKRRSLDPTAEPAPNATISLPAPPTFDWVSFGGKGVPMGQLELFTYALILVQVAATAQALLTRETEAAPDERK